VVGSASAYRLAENSGQHEHCIDHQDDAKGDHDVTPDRLRLE
jgi:hypothetical protein